MMFICNSTELEQVLSNCKSTNNNNHKTTWEKIFKDTPNLNNIITAATTDVNIESKVTKPKRLLWFTQRKILECTKKFKYIYRMAWLPQHWMWRLRKQTFRRMQKLMLYTYRDRLVLVKSYILKSIASGLMNVGRMRRQQTDKFTFASCVDKSMILTDEMWFTLQNVKEAKLILEESQTLVNIKHQNERLLHRTSNLSTSNSDPWKLVMMEKEPLLSRMYYYKLHKEMTRLKEWGKKT